MARASGRSMVECEREILGFDHAEVSAVMLARWEMPEYVHRAVAAHHAGEFASAIASPGEFANANSLSGAFVETNSCSPISLSRVLHCADRFVNSLGMTTVAGSAELDARAQLEMAGVELDHDEIVAQFAVEYDEFREFLL